MPQTILLAGNPVIDEGIAVDATIKPGHLIEFVPPGPGAGKLRRHANAGRNAAPMIALESTTPKEGTTPAIDIAYAAGDVVRYAVGAPGQRFYMWLVAGTGGDVAVGDLLESAGNGVLRKHTPQAVDEGGTATYTIYVKAPLFQALEAIDNDPGTDDAPVRIQVRVI
jgi:hypothetical protein